MKLVKAAYFRALGWNIFTTDVLSIIMEYLAKLPKAMERVN